MIRRYIHLKGQASLKQTAEDIYKNYIIYVLNILKLEGEQIHIVSSTNQQINLCMQMEAQRLHCYVICSTKNVSKR